MNIKTLSSLNFIPFLIAIISSLLLIIWNIPGTIALRHLLLAFGFIFSCFYFYKNLNIKFNIKFLLVSSYILVFPWMLFHFVFLSTENKLQLHELTSLWFRSALAFPIGFSIGVILEKSNGLAPKVERFTLLINHLTNISFMSVFLIFFVFCLNEIVKSNSHEFTYLYMIPYESKVPFMVMAAMALPICYIAIFNFKKLTIYSKFFYTFCTIAISVSIYYSNSKNANLIYAASLIIFAFWLLFKSTKKNIFKTIIIMFCLIFLCSLTIGMHFQKNSAWRQVVSDSKFALDVNASTYWKNHIAPLPINSDGQTVNPSTYDRISWFVAGLILVKENLLGYGLMHHSFGSLALKKWPEFRPPIGNFRGATHSGWLDFTLGAGVPGTLFLLTSIVSSWYYTKRGSSIWQYFVQLSAPLMVLAFTIAEAEGHYFELLIFFTSFYAGIAISTKTKYE